VYDARCLDPVAVPPLADEATKLTNTKRITDVIGIRGPAAITNIGEGFQDLERQRRGTSETLSKLVYTPCPEKKGTNGHNFDRHKNIVVILARNVVTVIRKQTKTTKVRRT